MTDVIFESLLNRSFTAFRRDRISDGQGGWTIGYVLNATFRGRIRPASSAERAVAQQEQRAISHVLYVNEGEDIAREDWVVGAGLSVDILGVREPSRADHHLEIDCLEVQRETTEVGS